MERRKGKNFSKSRTSIYEAIHMNNYDKHIEDYVKEISHQISEISGNDSKKKENNNHKNVLLNIPFVVSSESMDILNYIFSKKIRNHNDLFYIQHCLTNFKSLINSLYTSFLSDPDELLNQLSIHILMENYKKDQVICNYGDTGDKFYFIISGKVAVLVPKETKVLMTKKEYNAYLNKLFLQNQFEILLKTINANITKFNSFYVHQIKNSAEEEISKKNTKNGGEGPILKRYTSKSNFPSKIEFITVDEYINQTNPYTEDITKNDFVYDDSSDDNYSPKHAQRYKKQKMHAILWTYIKVASLSTGATFGDLALSQWTQKRTATIITTSNCSLGYLDAAIYKKCIKQSQEAVRKKDVCSIQSVPFFRNVSVDYFNQRYFNYFRIKEYHLGDMLFYQGEKRKEFYFLREGEIELTVNTSLRELNRIIKTFDESDNFHEEFYGKILNKKAFFRLLILKTNDSVGFDDIIYKNEFFANAKCTSLKCSIFSIEEKLFLDLIKDKKITESFNEYFTFKRNLMIKRLIHIRKTLIQSDSFKPKFPIGMNYKIEVSSVLQNFRQNVNTTRNVNKTQLKLNQTQNTFLLNNTNMKKSGSTISPRKTMIKCYQLQVKKFKSNKVIQNLSLYSSSYLSSRMNRTFNNKSNGKKSFLLNSNNSNDITNKTLMSDYGSINGFKLSSRNEPTLLSTRTGKTDEIDAFLKRIQTLTRNKYRSNTARNRKIMNTISYYRKENHLSEESKTFESKLDFIAVDNYIEKNTKNNNKNIKKGMLKGKKLLSHYSKSQN